MTDNNPVRFTDLDALADAIIDRTGRSIRLALPLGLGKANAVANALVERACADRSITLTIWTALTLEVPVPGTDLERRFLEPLRETYFKDYPGLLYAQKLRDGSLPDNIAVHEFYIAPGEWLGNHRVQQGYLSVNYTHALGTLLRSGFDVLAQQIAPPPEEDRDQYSLSCNPDISVDLLRARRDGRIDFLNVGQVNENLPFMGGDAVCPAGEFDLIFEGETANFDLFNMPHQPVSLADHTIGLRVAGMIPDGGTLQVGIGSIGDAINNALLLRHRENDLFRSLLGALGETGLPEAGTFERGLYGCSEMLVEGFLHLIEAGILKRDVDGVFLHAGFFIGSPLFYERLRALSDNQRNAIAMMPVSFTNQLYNQEETKRKARTQARFVNSALMATALGAVVSDGLEDGRVVSGVGGQYNFVAMAHELDGARSIITLPATRTASGRVESNILWNYGHETIPRHLRDMVVTEYGVADLRDQSDAETIRRMLAVTDARFQDDLADKAKAAGKLPSGYRIPDALRRNTPNHLRDRLPDTLTGDRLVPFPLGSAFGDAEERLAIALQELSTHAGSKMALARLAWRGLRKPEASEAEVACLERMGLSRAGSFRALFNRLLLRAVL